MVYKYTSIKTILAKVVKDLDLQEGNLRVSDMLEWAAEALEKIGAFPQFIIRTTGKDDIPLLEVANYQVELPYDFHRPIQLSYSSTINGPFYPMRYGTGSFDSNPGELLSTNNNVENSVASSNLVTLCMQLYDLSYAEAIEKINTEANTKSILESLLQPTSSNSTADYTVSDYTFTIRGGYIKTNVNEGYIMMAYQAIPTDLEGYPLVPDTTSFREAIYWYVNMKLSYPEWKAGRLRDAVYMDAKRSWGYYCKQAYGDAMMPDRPQLESIKNSWIRLIPNIHEQDTDFAHLGEQQYVYNHSTK